MRVRSEHRPLLVRLVKLLTQPPIRVGNDWNAVSAKVNKSRKKLWMKPQQWHSKQCNEQNRWPIRPKWRRPKSAANVHCACVKCFVVAKPTKSKRAATKWWRHNEPCRVLNMKLTKRRTVAVAAAVYHAATKRKSQWHGVSNSDAIALLAQQTICQKSKWFISIAWWKTKIKK